MHRWLLNWECSFWAKQKKRKKECAIWTGFLWMVGANPGLIIWRGTLVSRMTLVPWGALRRLCKKKCLYDCHGKRWKMHPKIENLAESFSAERRCWFFWGFFPEQYQRRPPSSTAAASFAWICILFPLPIILKVTECLSLKKGDSTAWFHCESINPKIDGQSITQ